MRFSRITSLAGLCLLVFATPLMALKTDRQEPLDVRADTTDGTLGDGMATLRGNVEINQGSLLVKADVANVSKAEGRVKHIELTGDPVHLQQEIENEGLVTANAAKIEYEVATGIVKRLREGVRVGLVVGSLIVPPVRSIRRAPMLLRPLAEVEALSLHEAAPARIDSRRHAPHRCRSATSSGRARGGLLEIVRQFPNHTAC